MQLKKITIFNYRSCLRTNIDISDRLTCLIGENGVGKSNILNALLLFKKIRGARFLPSKKNLESFSRSRINLELEVEGKVIKLKAVIFYDTDDKNIDQFQSATFQVNLGLITGKNKWLDVPSDFFDYYDDLGHRVRTINRYYIRTFRRTEKEMSLIIETVSFINRINYYSASQFSDPSRAPVSLELEESRTIRSARFTLVHEKFVNDLYVSYKKQNTTYTKFLNVVMKDGIGLIDNIDFKEYQMPSSSYEVRSGGKIKQIDKNKQLIVPFIKIGNSELSMNQLSEGTFKTMALIFYLISDTSNILLIEEPEVCVHHGLLNSIISLIITQSKTKQIIISTHSDFVLDNLSPSNIILVKKDDLKGTLANHLTKALSKNDYKALKKYLEQSGNLGEYWREGGLDHE